MEKFSALDSFFFENIDWVKEINALPLVKNDWMRTGEVIKYLLLTNQYKLTTDNIEIAKMQLLKFILKNYAKLDLSKFDTSDNYIKKLLPTPEEKKLCVVSGGEYIVSIRFKPVWFEDSQTAE